MKAGIPPIDGMSNNPSFFDNVQTMGIVNAVKTGNMHMDMVLAMCIPILMRYLMKTTTHFETYVLKFYSWLCGRQKRFSTPQHNRFITSRKTTPNNNSQRSPSVAAASEDHNKFLLQAVTMYLHSQVRLNLRDANVDLTDGVETNWSRAIMVSTLNTIGSVLKSYKLVKKPLINEWHDLGKYGPNEATVSLRIEQFSGKDEKNNNGSGNGTTSSLGDGDGKQTVHKYHFTSSDGEAIDIFLQSAYKWYVDTLRKREDNSRYLYELKSTGYKRYALADQDNNLQCKYKRYKLSNEKTFESLFFQEKGSLLELLRHFQKRSGKYAIKGYPHKLGLLLHGPPGTGKVRSSANSWFAPCHV